MGYRDDREGLRAKAESLAADLEETRRALEDTRAKLDAQESKDVNDERRIEQLEEKLAALEKQTKKQVPAGRPRPKGKRPVDSETGEPLSDEQIANMNAIGWILGGLAVFLVVVLVLALSSKDDAPAPNAPAPNAPPETKTGRVSFHGEVQAATGLSLDKGTSCELRATLGITGEDQIVPEVEIQCGPLLLYKRGETNGEILMSYAKWDYWEKPGPSPNGPHHYRMLFEDKGQRASKLFQVSLDTREHKIHLFRDEPERATVDIKVDEESKGRDGERLEPTTTP